MSVRVGYLSLHPDAACVPGTARAHELPADHRLRSHMTQGCPLSGCLNPPGNPNGSVTHGHRGTQPHGPAACADTRRADSWQRTCGPARLLQIPSCGPSPAHVTQQHAEPPCWSAAPRCAPRSACPTTARRRCTAGRPSWASSHRWP